MNMILKTLKRIKELEQEIVEEKSQLEYYEEFEIDYQIHFSKSKIAYRENLIRELKLDLNKQDVCDLYLNTINSLSTIANPLKDIGVTLSWCDDVPSETKTKFRNQQAKIEKLIEE